MEELTLAERYQIARIEAEQYFREFLEFSYENEGDKSREAKAGFIEQMANSKRMERECAQANAEELLESELAEEKKCIAKRIARNKARLQTTTDPRQIQYLQDIIASDQEYSAMSDDELKEVIVRDAEAYRERNLSAVKAEYLVAELGLTGKKNYLASSNIVGLYSPEVMGKVELGQIGTLADMIKQSDEFVTLQKFSKVEPVLDFFRYHDIFEKTRLGKMAEAKAESMDKMIDLAGFISQLNEMESAGKAVADVAEADEEELLSAVEEAEASTPDIN